MVIDLIHLLSISITRITAMWIYPYLVAVIQIALRITLTFLEITTTNSQRLKRLRIIIIIILLTTTGWILILEVMFLLPCELREV